MKNAIKIKNILQNKNDNENENENDNKKSGRKTWSTSPRKCNTTIPLRRGSPSSARRRFTKQRGSSRPRNRRLWPNCLRTPSAPGMMPTQRCQKDNWSQKDSGPQKSLKEELRSPMMLKKGKSRRRKISKSQCPGWCRPWSKRNQISTKTLNH